jgi:3-(3-hydroxy-phenyl)propionate hydroxylase
VFDVAVIGLGPVGELAALLLAREGLRVLAVDREASLYAGPRVGVLDGEALRTLQKAGIYERARTDMILGAGVQFASRSGKTLATTMPTEAPMGHPWISAIYQPLVDSVLREALGECGNVDIRLGHSLIGLNDVGGRVELTLQNAPGAVVTAQAATSLAATAPTARPVPYSACTLSDPTTRSRGCLSAPNWRSRFRLFLTSV